MWPTNHIGWMFKIKIPSCYQMILLHWNYYWWNWLKQHLIKKVKNLTNNAVRRRRDIQEISLLCRYHWKEGIAGERRPKDRVKYYIVPLNNNNNNNNNKEPSQWRICLNFSHPLFVASFCYLPILWTILGGLHFTSLHFALQLHTCKSIANIGILCGVCLMLWHME
jgi:hypothetical protein